MEPLSGLWADLKNAGRLPKQGVLMSTCEAELTQLMKQIDVMVQAKRAEWIQERQMLQAKLDLWEQENALTKGTLDQKHQEIGQLRCRVEASERDKRDVVEAYERQLRSLKSEVGTMRKDYERLKKQYRRFAHQDKNKALTEVEESSGELRKISKKLDDYRQKAKDWDQQKRVFLKQVEVLESERKMFEDKWELVQQQSTGYQTQLDKRRDMLDSSELTLRSQITQLEGQLCRARDTINAQDSQLGHLKVTLDDVVASQRRTLEEKGGAEELLQLKHAKVRQLETDLARCQSELEVQNAHVQASNSMSGQLARNKEKLEKAVSEKDAAIQKSRKSERLFRDEVAGLREKLDASRHDCEQLNAQMASKLEEKLTQLRASYACETEQLQHEVAQRGADLEKRDTALAVLSERSGSMEQTILQQEEVLDRKSAELQVANAQLEALRLESRHLRKTALRSATGTTENAEKHLKELQAAYTSSLQALENQNAALHQEVTSLREQMATLKEEYGRLVKATLRKTEHTLDKIMDKDQLQMEESRENAGQRALDMEARLQSTVDQYEAQTSQLKAEVRSLREDLQFRSKTLKRLGMEHNAMTHFVGGVEEVMQRQPHRETSILNTSHNSTSPKSNMVPVRDDDNLEDFALEPVDVVTEQFLLLQEERTRELERKLDLHIEGLKVNVEVSNRKLLNER